MVRLDVSISQVFKMLIPCIVVWYVGNPFFLFSIVYFDWPHCSCSCMIPHHSYVVHSSSEAPSSSWFSSILWFGHMSINKSFLSLMACLIESVWFISCWFLIVLADSNICCWIGSSCNSLKSIKIGRTLVWVFYGDKAIHHWQQNR